MNFRQQSLLLVISVLGSSLGHAVSTQVDFNNINTTVKDNTGAALDSGVDNVNGDGDLMEIGYFSGGSATFSGTWIAITGVDSNNPALVTTIGDLSGQDGGTPVPDGLFSFSATFNDATEVSPGNFVDTTMDLPAASTQLAIRFYDGKTRASSTYYNTVTSSTPATISNPKWFFVAPAGLSVPPYPSLNMDEDVLIWEDSGNAFQTTLVIPEPSSTALLGLGGLALLVRRRR